MAAVVVRISVFPPPFFPLDQGVTFYLSGFWLWDLALEDGRRFVVIGVS